MDIGRAFSFPFQDPRWVAKLLIAAAMVVIPIFGWLVLYGYGMRVTRQVATGTDIPLPEWEDFGGLFVDGLKLFAVTFVWSLPATLIGALAGGGGDASFAGSCLSSLVSLAVAFFLPAVIARVATTGSFTAGLDIGTVIALVQRNVTDYLLVLAVVVAAGIIAALGLVALCIGVLFTIPYAYLASSHVYGQAYYRSLGGPVVPTASAPF